MRLNPIVRTACTAFLLLLVSAGSALAQTPDVNEIVRRSLDIRRVKNSVQTLTMTVEEVKSDGSVRSGVPRTIVSKMRDDADATRSWMRFTAPTDMAGVQFVSVSRKGGGGSEQFMYFPPPDELVTRVSGTGKSGRFFGSDFSFEDLELQDVGTGTHTLLGEETITVGSDKITCYKVQTIPNAGVETQYGKMIAWVDKTTFVARQVLFFDKKGRELKRFSILKLVKDGSLYVPIDSLMEGLQRGSRSKLHVDSYKTNVPDAEIPLELFTEAGVKAQN